ncbi:MAG: hypothetical protein EBU84_01820 [Actinobacteria bacterium]|nr:hypothetical protein [Actinomycetota bacterium]
MASQDNLLQALQAINARSGATVKPQVAPTRRTNAIPQARSSSAPSFTASVNSAPNLSTASVDTINAQNQLNAYSMDKQVQYPGLTDQIKSAEAGIVKPSGALGALAHLFDNPVAKAALAPLVVLDTGRRAVISGVREIVDVLDTDKKTKASLTDWFKQTKDPSYGFGTAFPMKGWLGRTVGLIGDIALDPITWATLGASIPESAAIRTTLAGEMAVKEGAEALAGAGARAATQEAAKQVAEINLRKLLGTKSVATAEGRASLAGLVSRMGGSDELVKAIGAEGRRAFRTTQEGIAMAERLGLNRSGIYYFGSRVRVPFSGPIADMLETGLVKSRLGIMRSAPGEWISKNFTTAGTSSARSLKELKRGLALGKLTATEAADAAKLLTNESMSRAVGNMAKDAFVKSVKRHLGSAAARGELFDKDILEHAASIYKYLDIDPKNWAANGLPAMSETQQLAYNKIKNMFQEFHTLVEEQFKTIDPNFTLNKISDYFPHMMTDDAYRYVANNASKYAEEVRQYLKLNMTDPSSSFKARGLIPGAKFFGKTLDEKDIAKGIDGLNQIARDAGFKGNFFETDITKVLSRYGNHYAEQFATAEFMRKAIEDGILQRAKQMAVVDEDWLRSSEQLVKDATDSWKTSSVELKDSGSEAVAVIQSMLDDIKETLATRKAFVTGVAREAGTPEQRLAQLTAVETRLGLAVEAYKAKFDSFANLFSEKSELVDALRSQLDQTVEALTKTQNDLAEFASGYSGYFGQHLGADINNVMIDFKGQPTRIEDVQKSLDASLKRTADQLTKMENNWERTSQIHQEINDILNKRINIEYGTGNDVMDEVFDVLLYRGVRDATSAPAGYGAINRDWIGQIVNSKDESIVRLMQLIDPNGQLNQASLSRIRINDYYPSVEKGIKSVDSQLKKVERQISDLTKNVSESKMDVKETNLLGSLRKKRDALIKERASIVARRGKAGEKMIPGIRTRIARGLTVGDNMADLREAAIWLIFRDIKLGTPDIMRESIAGAKATSNVVDYISKNFGRYEALVNSLRDAEEITSTLSNKTILKAQQEVTKISKQMDNLTKEFFGTETPNWDNIPDAQVEKFMLRNRELAAQKVAAEKKLSAASSSLTQKNRDLLNRAGELGRYKDIVQNLAANTSEYYMHRETVIQFRRLASALDSVGMKPTEKMYNRVLASVAQSEFESVRQYSSRITELNDVLKRLRDTVSVLDNPDDLTRSIKFREELSKIFNANAGAARDNPEYARAVEHLDGLRTQLQNIEDSIPRLQSDIGKYDASVEKLTKDLSSKRNIRDKYKVNTVQWNEADAEVKRVAEELRYAKSVQSSTPQSIADAMQQKKTVLASIKDAEKNLKSMPKNLYGTREAELIREFMPEIEAVWLYDKLDTPQRLFYRDAEGQQLMSDILEELRAIGKEPEWGKPITRRPRVVSGAEGTGDEALRGMRIVGGSESQRLARIDSMQTNIEQALATLSDYYRGKSVRIAPDVTLGYDQPLVQTLTGQLRNVDLSQLGILKSEQIDTYRARYNSIVKRIKTELNDAADRAKTVAGSRKPAVARKAIREAMLQPEKFGFANSFSNALDYGGVAIDDFFSSLVGGQKLVRGTRDYTKIIRKGKSMGQLRSAEFETIEPASSYFGKLNKATQDRIMGLRYLMNDPDIPTELLVEGDKAGSALASSSWVMNKSLRGQQAYADALEEHADRLLVALENDKQILTDLKKKEAALLKVEREYDGLVGGPMGAKPTPRTKRLEEIEVKNMKAQKKIDELKSTAMQSRAETMQREHLFAQKLAHFNREDVNQMLSLGGPDMQQYHFTADEWGALWNENTPEETLQSLRGRKGALSRELGNLPKDNADARWQSAVNPKIAQKLRRADEVREQIRVIDSMIAKHEARSSAIAKFGQVERIFNNKDFMQLAGIDIAAKPGMTSADAIFAIGNTSHMSQYFKDLNVKFPSKTHIDARHMILDSTWKASDEYKHLRAIDALTEEMNWGRHQQFIARRDLLLARHKELRDMVGAMRTTSDDATRQIVELETKISSLLEKTEPVYGPIPKAKQGEDLAVRQAKERAQRIRMPEDGVQQTAREYVAIDQNAIDAGMTQAQQDLVQKNREFEEIARMVENLQFDKIVSMNMENKALDYISLLNTQQKELLKKKISLTKQLEKEMGTFDQMAAGTTKAGKAVTAADDRVLRAAEAVRTARVRYDNAQTFADGGPEELRRIEEMMSDLRKIVKDGKFVKGTVKKGDDSWVASVQQLLDESMYMFHQVNGFGVSDDVRRVATSLADARNEFLRQTFFMNEAQQEKALVRGIKAMMKDGAAIDPASVVMAGGKVKIVDVFDEGFVQLSKYFPNIGVKKEMAEIFQNVHRINQPLLARELSKFLSKYTTFFKAYATLSPGFHLRNSMSNGFMLFAAGGTPKYLAEGLEYSRSWIAASKRGVDFEEWILSIPKGARQKVSDAFKAAAASGGGVTDDMIASTVPFGTKSSRKLGQWIEQHSRFMLAYDGVASGMDFASSAARVKRFLIDYQDLSTADAYMRQIVPFWMWTSRNLPMQLQNMWLNPRAYAIYNSIKRNIEDKESDKAVPLWMRELGAFKLPFGKDLYATPDFGFNRVQQQIQELRDPRRALANVNPILRLPIELTGGRQLYSNRQFSDQPIEVKDGAGALLQPFLAAAGYGETTPEGKKFVNDKAYYALRNLIPFLGTAERLTPSIQTYQQRGYVNPLLGFLGIPTRQLTEQEQQSELARRKREIQNIVSKERTLQGNE